MCMKQNVHHLRLTNKELPENAHHLRLTNKEISENSHHFDQSECSEFSKSDI